jgi:hypothetical protein
VHHFAQKTKDFHFTSEHFQGLKWEHNIKVIYILGSLMNNKQEIRKRKFEICLVPVKIEPNRPGVSRFLLQDTKKIETSRKFAGGIQQENEIQSSKMF